MDAAATLVSVVRGERARLVATLVRRYGFDLAEDVVDAAIESALTTWPISGVPTSPSAWLLSVARRRAIDRVRHRIATDDVHASLLTIAGSEGVDDEDPDAATFPDDRLKLVFTCCHPAIAREAQVALALRWISGLSTEDVARAFCVAVPTMAQRLTRAKTKIETARIPYEVPEHRELPERLATVLEVIYAIFNEGCVATMGTDLQRIDLADEGVRLASLVVGLLPTSPEPRALLALLVLVEARRAARVGSDGELVPLEEQDRALWDAAAVARGKELLTQALALGPPSTYAIEAAIQAVHDEATSYASTDFGQIAKLYELLVGKTDAPVVRVNLAVARSMVHGPSHALNELLALDAEESLAVHPALAAAKADLYRRLERWTEARTAYDAAIAVTRNDVERRFLMRPKAALPHERTRRRDPPAP